MEIVRVLRVVEYVGPREAVEEQVAKSIHGARQFPVEGGEMRITAVTVGEFPEVLEPEMVTKAFPGSVAYDRDVSASAREGWENRVLVLWEEDDARPPDREGGSAAFRRITGVGPRSKPIDSYDGGDSLASLYWGGWVKGCDCGLSWVGVLVK